ncbi:MAG: hypothetical protein UEY91_07795 [Lachnospiraceae bacterium]|nr:hypothetical protein [Lachnospiraceae bacterium]
MNGNWIKISRGIRDSWVWDEPRYLKWWIDILMLASYKNKKVLVGNELIELERGSFITSQSQLAKRWNADRRTVKKYLDLLQDAQMIVHILHRKKTIVKVLNYSIYQDTGESNWTTSGTDECTDKCTGECTDECAQHKKGKKEKNIYILAQGAGARVIPPTLEDVKSYCKENSLVVNPEEFFRAYDPDWMKGNEPIRDWQGLLRGWNRKAVKEKDKPVGNGNRFRNFDEREHSDDYYDDLEQALLKK